LAAPTRRGWAAAGRAVTFGRGVRPPQRVRTGWTALGAAAKTVARGRM